MILSNIAIHNALDSGWIKIDPEPTPRFPTLANPDCPYDSTAVDLTLSPKLSVPKQGLALTFDLRQKNVVNTLKTLCDHRAIDPANGYVLGRDQFVLGSTREQIALPIPVSDDKRPPIAARVEGKSSRARIGLLVHFTAPTIHAGFDGTITLEIINMGAMPITLFPGVPICQLIFEFVKGIPTKHAPSQFQHQVVPTGPDT